MTLPRKPTHEDRCRVFAGWRRRQGLTRDEAMALLAGLSRVGLYLEIDDNENAALRLRGDTGSSTLRGFMTLHGLGPEEER